MLRFNEWTFSSPDSDVRHKITDIRLYSDDREKIEIELKPVRLPESGRMAWEDWNCFDSICVYKTDYERLLLSAIEALFPVTDPDPDGWGVQEYFDLTSMNFFGKADWLRLTDSLTACAEKATGEEKEFYRAVLGYLKEFMTVSEWFCIEDNL